MIAFISTKINLLSLYNELNKREVKYFTDELFYAENDYRTRVFVFGCDVKKVIDLKDKYLDYKNNSAKGYFYLIIIAALVFISCLVLR